MMFGVFSLFLWLTVAAAIPWLRDAFGIAPILGWYLSGTLLVLLPIAIFGGVMAWRELPVKKMSEWRKRLRLVHMNRGDFLWMIIGRHCLPGEMDRGPIGQRTLTKVVEYTVNRETRQI